MHNNADIRVHFYRSFSIMISRYSIPLLLLISFPTLAESWQLGGHNDAISDSDGNYSNALFVNYTAQAKDLPDVVPFLKGSDLNYATSIHFGQKIWTPSDISFIEPQANERPYAGLSYLEFSALGFNLEQTYRVSAMVGITGEKSKARRVQTEIHRLLDVNKPQGWDNQIEEEIVYQVNFESEQLLGRADLSFAETDLSTFLRLSAGNFQSDIGWGYTLRWGNNLGANFNNLNLHPYRMQGLLLPKNSSGVIAYLTGEVFYRLNDITIEGDRPNIVPDTTVEHIQNNLVGGVLIYDHSFGVNISVISFTPSFKEDLTDRYVIAALGFYWRF